MMGSSGALIEALPDWKITYEGYYMYYPNRHLPPLFRLFVEALKLKVS
jgi:DNA-binding transcriptional LysR family regulator